MPVVEAQIRAEKPQVHVEHAQWTRSYFKPESITDRSDSLRDGFGRKIKAIQHQQDIWQANHEKNGQAATEEQIRQTLNEIRSHNYSQKDILDSLPEILGSIAYVARHRLPIDEVRQNQLEAAIALVRGNKPETPKGKGVIAQLPTGEGKTIVAATTAASYAMMGENTPVFVASSNDYLAPRDMNEMGALYHALGLRVSYIAPGGSDQYEYDPSVIDDNGYHFKKLDRRSDAYSCDVVYGSTAEFAFDYLRDGVEIDPFFLRQVKGRKVLIQDEADQIMVDDAATPLIIEGPVVKEDPAMIVGKKEVRPKEIHEKMEQIVRLLDKSDLIIDPNQRTVRVKTDKDGVTEISKPSGKEIIVTNRKDERALTHRLRNAGLLRPHQTLHDRFTDEEIGHLLRGFERKGTYRLAEYLKAFHLLEDTHTITQRDGTTKEVPFKTHYASANGGVIEYYLRAALQAHVFIQRKVAYDITASEEGTSQAELRDPLSGRSLEGRRLAQGLHEAVEAREGLPIQNESRRITETTYEEFFAQFDHIAGLTATAASRAEELFNVYGTDVVEIPGHEYYENGKVLPAEQRKRLLEQRRHDSHEEVIYSSRLEKFRAIFRNEIQPMLERVENGDGDLIPPILIGLKTSDAVLAFQSFWEQEVVPYIEREGILLPEGFHIEFLSEHNIDQANRVLREAGLRNRITVTDLAGRGVDSQLGGPRPKPSDFATYAAYQQAVSEQQEFLEQAHTIEIALNEGGSAGPKPVLEEGEQTETYETRLVAWQEERKLINEAGGMRIIGEHGSVEDDLQLKGRTARNGDNGSSIFYSSTEDYLLTYVPGATAVRGQLKQKYNGRFKITGEEAKSIMQQQQAILYNRNVNNRTRLREEFYPLREAREAYVRRRTQLLEGKGVTYDTQIYDWVNRAIGKAVTTYADSPEYRSRTNIDKAIEELFKQYGDLLQLDDTQVRVHGLRAALHTTNDPTAIYETLQTFARERYEQALEVLEERVEQSIVLEYARRHDGQAVPEDIAAEYFEEAWQQILRQMVLETMDAEWQTFSERMLESNQRTLSLVGPLTGIKDPLSAMRTEVQERFEELEEDILTHIAKNAYRIPVMPLHI